MTKIVVLGNSLLRGSIVKVDGIECGVLPSDAIDMFYTFHCKGSNDT